ncbi:hypothetical protein [Trinickia diaoshuihuensis]|uniref:hypothetical protein n=1 Tax=Trinickia diaoshuihuensis TaxID=2292265 RepID=UPI001F075E8D|nr:hypothetical protein [Trinickia diaoshuihuensis]
MATKNSKLAVFAWLPTRGFSPAGLLTLTESVGANQQNRELTSGFAYGLGYLARAESIEVDPSVWAWQTARQSEAGRFFR